MQSMLEKTDKQHDTELLISVPRAAARVGLGTSKVYELIDQGLFPHLRIPGVRRVLVPVKALEQWVETHTRQPDL